MAQDKKSRPANTTIGSINIQSAKGNSVYLKQILDDCDILCIQEHWLLSLEKKILNNANEKYNVTSKSVDDDNIRLDYRSWRGNGGIAIFWKKSIDHAMTVMPDGNNRIQVVTMNSSHKNCCIVNVYMPSEAKEGDYEYKDNLDQLQEIIQKYDNSYQIIVCGDMNASLHRDDRRRDNLFRNCIHENGLKLANNHPERPTFFHHNGKYKSQIDYFLFKSTEHLNASVKIKEMDALNTSDHTLVLATVGVDVKRAAPKAAKILTKPRWEKCDHNIYKDCIQNEINNLEK